DKYGGKVLYSYPKDRSQYSMIFMSNIPLAEVVELVRLLKSTNVTVGCAKQLRKELLNTVLIPNGYL
ncbi:hypothetical protein HHI36_017146, partial [Cryptolaemus montrouzieri]